MKLHKLGKNTSRVEILNVSPRGVWILVNETEYVLPYERFPWFQNACVADVYHVELLRGHHLRWPKLDVDLELESLQELEKYPLVYK